MDHIGVGHKTKNTVKHIYRSDYNLMKSYLDLMKSCLYLMKLLSTYITRSPLHTRTHMYAHVHTRTSTSRVINSNCNREITVLIVDRSSSTLVAFNCICYVFVI